MPRKDIFLLTPHIHHVCAKTTGSNGVCQYPEIMRYRNQWPENVKVFLPCFLSCPETISNSSTFSATLDICLLYSLVSLVIKSMKSHNSSCSPPGAPSFSNLSFLFTSDRLPFRASEEQEEKAQNVPLADSARWVLTICFIFISFPFIVITFYCFDSFSKRDKTANKIPC